MERPASGGDDEVAFVSSSTPEQRAAKSRAKAEAAGAAVDLTEDAGGAVDSKDDAVDVDAAPPPKRARPAAARSRAPRDVVDLTAAASADEKPPRGASSRPTPRPRMILAAHGSWNPVTRAHVAMVVAVREFFEAREHGGYEVARRAETEGAAAAPRAGGTGVATRRA